MNETEYIDLIAQAVHDAFLAEDGRHKTYHQKPELKKRQWRAAAVAAISAERERCARIAEEYYLKFQGIDLEEHVNIRKNSGARITSYIRLGLEATSKKEDK